MSIFPRWNFLLLATNQLVNHLDKFSDMSDGGYQPKAIIRTSIGSRATRCIPAISTLAITPRRIARMLHNVEVIRLEEARRSLPMPTKRPTHGTDGKSTILVEYGDYYNEK